MAVTGTLGSRLFITLGAIASTIDTEAEFSAQDWGEVGLIESFGEFGRVFDNVTFVSVAEGRTRKLKGAFNDGAFQLTLGQDLSDAYQAVLADAAEDPSQDNFGFRVELNDAPVGGGPTTFFLRGLPMSFRTGLGGANTIVKATASIEVNSDVLAIPPADFRQTFDGVATSVAAFDRYKGSDAEAALPSGAGPLIFVSGNAGTGFAADGSQAILHQGYTLSGGPVVLEAQVEIIAAATNLAFFFGLTDQNAALEIPIESAASVDTITTNATDAVGFMFDTAMATDRLWLVGVNNNVDETKQDSGVTPAVATNYVLRLEVAANGDAVFKVNGAVVGTTMTTACRTSVPLYATMAVSARATASREVWVPRLYLRQD